MRRPLALVLAAVVAAQAANYLVRPLTSYRLLALGAGPREVGLVAAAFAVVPMLLAIPLGRLADSRSAAPLAAAGCAVLAVAAALLGRAPGVGPIAAATALFGLGHLAVMLGVQNLIARHSDDVAHDRRFGLFTASVSAGQLLGPLLLGPLLAGGGQLAGTTRGLDAAAAFAVVATGLAVAAGRLMPRLTHERAEAPLERGVVRTLARTPGVPAGLLASVAVLSAGDVVTAYLPVLGRHDGIGPGVVGVLLALRAGASVVARIGIDASVRRVGRARLIAVSAWASALAVGALTLTRDPAVLAVFALAAGYGLGFGQPLSMTLVVQRVPPRARATALGLRLTGNRLGQVAVPALGGLLAGGAGVASVFWLLAGLLAAAGVAVRRGLRE